MKIAVTSASGIEAVTKRELYKLTGITAPSLKGRLVFEGGLTEIAKCNLFLRTASRVFVILGEFKASDFESLFENTKAIPFEEIIPVNGKILVYGKCVESKLMAVSACQSIVKKAICERLKQKYKNSLTETGEEYKIEISLFHDIATISLNTSGESLHKRGYRSLVGEAPLKENVASALIQLSVWNPSRPLTDVFCGSGTIPIEAAMLAMNIPSGLNRDFDFLHYKKLDFSFFKDIKDEAISNIKYDKSLRISGFDIDEKQIELARKHAVLAGVSDYIHLQRGDMRNFSSRFSHGVIISNPPYGERLLTRKQIVTLYRDYGKMFSSLDNWCCYTLSPVTDFEKLFAKTSDKKRKIYNGKLECFYYEILGQAPKKQDNYFKNT